MGTSKASMHTDADLLAAAREICIEAGALRRCEACDSIVASGATTPEEAKEYAEDLFVARNELASRFRNYDEMLDAIDRACNEAPDHCVCAR